VNKMKNKLSLFIIFFFISSLSFLTLVQAGLNFERPNLIGEMSDEDVYQNVLGGGYATSDQHKQQLVNYLNDNPNKQKAFFEKKGVKFESSGVDISSYEAGVNEGESITLKLKNSEKEFTIDLENNILNSEDSEFKPLTEGEIEIKILDDKISIKSDDTITESGKNGDSTFHKSLFVGEVSIYPDGHRDIEKGTTYTVTEGTGSLAWHVMELSSIDENGNKVGIQEKIQFSDDPSWTPTDTETPVVKTYKENGQNNLEIKNINSKIQFDLSEGFNIKANDALKIDPNSDPIIPHTGSLKFPGRSEGDIHIKTRNGEININERGTWMDSNIEGISGDFFAGEHTLKIGINGNCQLCSDCVDIGHIHKLRESIYVDRNGNKFSINKGSKTSRITLQDVTRVKSLKTNEKGYKHYETYNDNPLTRGLTQQEINEKFGERDVYGSDNEVFLVSPEKRLFYNEDIKDGEDDWIEIISEKSRLDQNLPRPFMPIDDTIPEQDRTEIQRLLKGQGITNSKFIPEPLINKAKLPGVSQPLNRPAPLSTDRYIPSHENKDLYLFYDNHMKQGQQLKYVIRYNDKGFYAIPAPSYKGSLPPSFSSPKDLEDFVKKNKGWERVR